MIYHKHLKESKVVINWYIKTKGLRDEQAMYFVAEIDDERLNNINGAIEWYRKSAELSKSDVVLRCVLIYDENKREDINNIKWFEKAYKLGSV
ncbi:hypothetical protein SAMN04488700_0150 [Carnobacterium iners]|uniref:Sel1 repeat-containing protein n=2 Tax=Carnobacterium iners TaxID=1073423 RepID=A0A1X7MPE0_9LACT|nr:hypothetical protein SAMN04488114_11153 [Carnobacterium iners]SMH26484.1 hypothetical protein SAMN04488700_0150 [Carnobacterium iners]